MKKIIATILSAALFSTTLVGAMTRSEFLTATGLTEQPDVVAEQLNHTVESDIQVKLSSATDYGQGTVNVMKSGSDSFPLFDFKDVLYMDSVRDLFQKYIDKAERFIGDDVTELDNLDATPITGQFKVKITCPTDVTIPSDIIDEAILDEVGFSSNVKGIFNEVSRTYTRGSNAQMLEIVLDVVAPTGSLYPTLTCGDLKYNLLTFLPDLEFECLGVQPTNNGRKTIRGEMTGEVYIGGTVGSDGTVTEQISKVTFTAAQRSGTGQQANGLAEDISVTTKSTPSPIEPSRPQIIIIPTNTVSIIFDINGKTDEVSPVTGTTTATANLDETKAPEKAGLKFDMWYYDKEFTKPATGTITVDTNTVLYGRYLITEGIEVFDTDTHNLYILGYPDGTVQPNGDITREEIAQALYRLLKKDVRDSIATETNSFTDVPKDRWSNLAISSMAAAGFVNGYDDGSFRPGQPITRAEFATIATRFFASDDNVDSSGIPYSDVPFHWAEDYIVKASNLYIIRGYDDGTFRPDRNITRAEAMTIINRMTIRHTDAAGLINGAKTWPDLTEADWYYYEVMEATNSHAYMRREDKYYENWTELTEQTY